MKLESEVRGANGESAAAEQDRPSSTQRPPEMLAFFPWLRVGEHLTVGPYELLAYIRGDEPGGKDAALQDTLDTVLEPYVAARGEPIDQATLVRYDGRDLTAGLTDEERTGMFEFSELLAFSGLATRTYFQSSYWNSDHFRCVIQSFGRADGGALIRTRRRDGGTQSYWPHEHLTVARPFHVGTTTVNLDHAFLGALVELKNAEEWTRYREAIETFNLANTDSADLREEVELVLLNGAFERLFNLDRGREDQLANAFCNGVAPSSNVHTAACDRFANRQDLADRIQGREFVRDVWVRDFFRLRGNLAHGRREPVYPSLWNLHEHLLLGSFIFPLAFKKALEQDGFYVLTEDDRCRIDAFEALACAEHFTEASTNKQDFSWERTIRRAGLERRIRQYVEGQRGD